MQKECGFTLIELSIVLVIIGLIVGGVLVGQDLIRAAAVRAQITQIEKFNQAVNTFRGKYGYLPGDIPDPDASKIGLFPRGLVGAPSGIAGAGDGNGLIEGVGNANNTNSNCGTCLPTGEPVIFWNDLTYANGQNFNLIEGSFAPCPTLNYSGMCTEFSMGDPGPGTVSMTQMGAWLPPAKLGRGNYVYAYSTNGSNYFGISVPTAYYYAAFQSNVGTTVNEAYNIDRKVDDGFPQTGTVTATYVNNTGNTYPWPVSYAGVTDTSAVAGSSSTCYDNGGIAGTQKYSVTQRNGNGANCALSFKFQ